MEKNDITPKLILLSEFLDQSKRKDKEIAFYERELKKIEHKLYWLRREKDLTQTIISIISEEIESDETSEATQHEFRDVESSTGARGRRCKGRWAIHQDWLRWPRRIPHSVPALCQ